MKKLRNFASKMMKMSEKNAINLEIVLLLFKNKSEIIISKFLLLVVVN
jgi:hypothetical protein